MTNNEDRKLDALLGKASSFSPSSDFTSRVMQRINNLPEQEHLAVSSIHKARKRWYYPAAGMAAALIGALVVGTMVFQPQTHQDINSLAMEIDDALLLEQASLDLNQEDLTYAMCEMSSKDGDNHLAVNAPVLFY